jgi:hypothetical protein
LSKFAITVTRQLCAVLIGATALFPIAQPVAHDRMENIFASVTPRILFSDGAVAAVVFNTTRALDIEIYYGVWPQFQFIAGASVQGGTSHSVFLSDLKPGETYFYQIVGIATDGSEYRSEEYKFSVPTANNNAFTGETDSDVTITAPSAPSVGNEEP